MALIVTGCCTHNVQRRDLRGLSLQLLLVSTMYNSSKCTHVKTHPVSVCTYFSVQYSIPAATRILYYCFIYNTYTYIYMYIYLYLNNISSTLYLLHHIAVLGILHLFLSSCPCDFPISGTNEGHLVSSLE